MSSYTLSDLPEPKEISKSPYDLDFIRRKLSVIIQEKTDINSQQLALIELIFCLANEIAELKATIETIKPSKYEKPNLLKQPDHPDLKEHRNEQE